MPHNQQSCLAFQPCEAKGCSTVRVGARGHHWHMHATAMHATPSCACCNNYLYLRLPLHLAPSSSCSNEMPRCRAPWYACFSPALPAAASVMPTGATVHIGGVQRTLSCTCTSLLGTSCAAANSCGIHAMPATAWHCMGWRYDMHCSFAGAAATHDCTPCAAARSNS